MRLSLALSRRAAHCCRYTQIRLTILSSLYLRRAYLERSVSGDGFQFFLDSRLFPSGFVYPTDYVVYANAGEVLQMGPWEFLWSKEPASIFAGLGSRYPDRCLVPFARRVDSDDVACFDRSDATQRVTVSIVHDFASAGWEQRERFESFTEWLSWVLAGAGD
jgi:hypothetical protein